jgi:amino acid permease
MILEILIIVTTFLWALSLLPFPQVTPYRESSYYFAFVDVLLIVLYLFASGLRG